MMEPQQSLPLYLSGICKELPPQIPAVQAVAEIMRAIEDTGGATYNRFFGNQANSPLPAYAVAVLTDLNIGHDTTNEDEIPRALHHLVSLCTDILSRPRCCLGVWKDVQDGSYWVEISIIVLDITTAIYLGIQYNQYAIYDLWRDTVVTEREISLPKPTLPPPCNLSEEELVAAVMKRLDEIEDFIMSSEDQRSTL